MHIEPLPLTSTDLPVHVPKSSGMSSDDYLGRTALYIDHEASPALFRPGPLSLKEVVTVRNVADIDFASVCQALSLESNSHVEAGFFWSHYQSLPGLSQASGGGSWSFGTRFERWPITGGQLTERFSEDTGTLRPDGSTGPELSESRLGETLMAINALGPDHSVRMAISRWMGSRDHRQSMVDRFIDLRIALEALYLKNFISEHTNQEMRFRLALFGAWHLGDSFSCRQSIRKKLRDSYDRASAAVHTGSITDYPTSTTLLSDGQDLCRKGILKLLKEGFPKDWGDLILGVEYAGMDVCE